MVNSLQKAKLRWHCRRGMLELDLILMPFAEHYLDKMTEAELRAFEELLNCIDPELYDWLMGYSTPTNRELAEIVELIKLQNISR